MAPKRKSSDAGNSAKPKRSREVLPLSEKIKILDLIQKEKKSYAAVAKMYGKNESSIREVMKKEKDIRASVAFAPHTAKVTSTVRDKCLVKMENTLNLWVEDMNRRRVRIDGNELRQKALSLYEDFTKGSTEKSATKPFTASKGWLHRFRNRFGLKNIKITGEAASADEEAAATFPTELKLIEEKGYHPKQDFNYCDETGLFWEKMPNRTYINESVEQAPEHKPWKDSLTLVLCGNAAGNIKSGVVYRAQNQRALKNLPGIDGEIRKIIYAERRVGGERFVDMLDEEVEKHIEYHREVLTNEELEEHVKSSPKEEECEEEETQAEPAMWTLEKFAEVFRIAQTLKDKIMEYDPRIERSIKVTRMITEGLQPLQQHFDELKRNTQQPPITMFFPNVSVKQTTSTIEDPQPSTSYDPDIIQVVL